MRDREGAYRRGEAGQGLAEYSLILAFIAMVVIAAVTLLGTTLDAFFTEAANIFQVP